MAQRGRVVALEGPSASGKTTLLRAASRAFGWRVLPEAYDRLDPVPSLRFRSATELLRLEGALLAEEARRSQDAERWARSGATVLADTGFLGPLTYTRGLVALGRAPAEAERRLLRAAEDLLDRGALALPDVTVYLAVSATERARRARADPAGHPFDLADRHEAVGRLEKRYFLELLRGRAPERFRLLRAAPTVAGTARRLDALLRSVPPGPTPPEVTRHFLRDLRPPSASRSGPAAAPTVKKGT